jgi:Domain of unknown function (DUF4183)
MAVFLSPFGGVGAQFFDNNGNILAGGKIYTYAAGTNTPQTTYTTSAGNIAQANPIVLDASGRVPSGEIWLTLGDFYKFVLEDVNSNLIGTYDNISGIGGGLFTNIADFTGDGSATTFILPQSLSSKNFANIYINGVYQNKSTYSISGTSLVFSEAPPFTSKIEVEY